MQDFWNDICWGELLWRYFTVERLESTLKSSRLYFAPVDQFKDTFECSAAVQSPDLPIDPRYQQMNPAEEAFFRLRRHFKINCWHRAEFENDAMWQLYANQRKGAAICSTPERMRKA